MSDLTGSGGRERVKMTSAASNTVATHTTLLNSPPEGKK